MVEYIVFVLVDLEFYFQVDFGGFDVQYFEKIEFDKIGMLFVIIMWYWILYFQYIFFGDGYLVGYYSYMWLEVMDVDVFGVFEEKGNIFDLEMVEKLLFNIYFVGG